jgi:GTP:adenosylcobinamide-phosphate guanylyltransferase
LVNAIILAGKTSSVHQDPLLEYVSSQGNDNVKNKALIRIAGQEMIRYVVDAVNDSKRVQRTVVVGLDREECDLPEPVECVSAPGDMYDNIMAGMEHLLPNPGELPGPRDPLAAPMLAASSDIPLLTTEVVDYFIDACQSMDADLYYSLVERSVMEASFPTADRTFVRLRDGAFAGGDLMMLSPSALRANRQLFRELAASRKNALKMARMLGLGMILRFLTHSLTVVQAERKASQILGCRAKAVISLFAELGMDVDKPHQLDIVSRLLTDRN